MRYPVVAKTIFSGSLQNTKNSFKIIEADAGLFFVESYFRVNLYWFTNQYIVIIYIII